LRERFARQPKLKAFVGWQTYYRAFLEDSTDRALIDFRGPFVGDELHLRQVIDAILAGRKVCRVSAPPGCGKSRFALELARRIGRSQPSWDVRFARHDEPAAVQEMHELSKGKRLVLIVDDAHDCPTLVEQLAAVCAGVAGAAPTHLVCLTQPAGHEALTEALANHLPVSETLDIDLGRPSAKLVRELIDKTIPQLSPHHRDVIRRFVADSFFAPVLLCASVARQKALPQTLSTRNLRDYAIRQPVAQAIRDLCPVEKALSALAVYAACAPVRSGDTSIRTSAAALAGLTVPDVEVLEQRVLEAGLFQVDGRGWLQPVPALVGDLILEETCLNEQGSPNPFGQTLIRALFEGQQYEPVIRNCGDIARLFATPASGDFLCELLLERANGLSVPGSSGTDQAAAFALLSSCSGLAGRQPEAIVRLVAALTAKGILRADPPARELGRPNNPEARAQVLLATASEHDPTIVPTALDYARRLLSSARADAGSYRAVRDKLAASCRFAVARPLAHATAVLDVLNGWIASPEVESAELAAALVHGFLRLDMHVRRWEEGAVAAVSVGLNPTDENLQVRDRALDILVRCARHPSTAVQHAAADSLVHWARGFSTLPNDVRERWLPRLNREVDLLAESFGKLGATTTYLPVRAAVEHQGWRWWIDGVELCMQRAGKRLLEALPEDKSYPLWKALHAATLPIFPIPLDESIELQHRRERFQALVAPPAERVPELAKELFDRLDAGCSAASAWAALFASVLSAVPKQPLQPGAHLYLAEFVRRHSTAAWSFVSEANAQGALATILPAVLAELRGQDRQRWHEAMQLFVPGTRLFEVKLGALCAGGELDDVERALVSKGLELDKADAVHLSAQALLGASRATLGPGLSAVFGVLPRRPADERLWELTLDAFARWGEHVLSAPVGEEADPEVRASSSELLRLLRAHGSSLSWRDAPYTRRLTTVVAIFAVAIPHTLKSWMRELWSPAVDRDECALPLSTARLLEMVRLIAKSSTASYWQKQFVEWITEEPILAKAGASGLSVLCGLADPCVGPLVTRIAHQPTAPALDALGEFLERHASAAKFVEDTLSLLRGCVDTREVYDLLEREVISVCTRGPLDALRARGTALEVVNGEFPPALRETLARVRQAIQATVEESLLRGAAH
jgi:hypothetical protein